MLVAENQDNRSREQCIALRLQGYSQNRIAEMLGVSQSTVRHHTRHLPAVKTPRVTCRRSVSTPEPLPPSSDFAYLLGVFAGDGNLAKLPRTCKLVVSCSTDYPDLIEGYADLIQQLTGLTVKRTRKREKGRDTNCIDVYVYSQHLPAMLGLPCGAKVSSGFAVPDWIWHDDAYARAFLRGLIETDGGVYRTSHNGGTFWYCAFTAKVPAVVDAFSKAVVQLGYPFKQYGPVFRLSNSDLTRRLIRELGITKLKAYEYGKGSADKIRGVAQLG